MPTLTLSQYYDECVHMLSRQPGDWHIGAAQRTIIAQCHKDNRPISSAVGYIMQPRNGYSPVAVQAAIDSSNRHGRRIGGREAKAIHALLRGRH